MNIILEFFSAFAVIIVLAWWYLFLKHRKVSQFYKHFSGPPGVPVLGNALDFKNKTKGKNLLLFTKFNIFDFFLGILPVFMNYNKYFGGLVKIQIGPIRKLLLVSDYKFLEFVLSSTKIINKSQNYKTMLPWLGTGLLTSEGIKWKKHRRIITPTFHFKILEQFINSFDTAGDIMIKKLQKKVGHSSVDIYPIVTLCALDIICGNSLKTFFFL